MQDRHYLLAFIQKNVLFLKNLYDSQKARKSLIKDEVQAPLLLHQHQH